MVLIDSSVWIDYFKGAKRTAALDFLIEQNLLVTNDIILAELVPFLKIKQQNKLVHLLSAVKKLPLDIHWDGLIALQTRCMQLGENGVGLVDLMIAQNATQHRCKIYTLDRHFQIVSGISDLECFS